MTRFRIIGLVLIGLAHQTSAADLQADLDALAAAHKGTVAIAVRDLTTGEAYAVNADVVMPTASLIKLPIMVGTYRLAENKKVRLTESLVLKAEDKVPGSGILTTHFSPGATFSLRDGVRLMIAYSDNTATNLVLGAIGIDATNEQMNALGYPETRVNAKVFRGSTTSVDPERTKKYGLGSTTARDMVGLLARLHAGELASEESTAAMIGHLKACDDKDGFPRFLPAGTKIAHKTGAVNEARTEAGILYLPSGPVALCVLTNENEDRQWTNDNAGLLVRANAAKLVADHFAAKANPASKDAPDPADESTLDGIDAAVLAAIDRGDIPGAVVLIVRDDKPVYRKAFGYRAVEPTAEVMTPDTIFDMASLTKPMATAASVHVLIEQGKLALTDTVAKHWPEFAANGKGEVTIEQCLLHTSGLTADNAIADYADGRGKALERVAGLGLEAPPGTRFRYSDVGYIVLGELVTRVSGKPVDEFAAENVFSPLKMTDTGYRPSVAARPRVAPTGLRDGEIIRGEVHDPRAFRLDGVAGHAGLFSTADDMSRFARMLIRGGELDAARVMSAASMARYTTPHNVPVDSPKDADTADRPMLRSYGWDVDTGFTSQRGGVFEPGTGYGHTGFTGTSLWVDPPTRTAIVVLTNRVHPNDKGNVIRLRKEIGTIVGEWVR